MNRWVSRLLLAVLPAAGLLAAVGCCDVKGLQKQNDELQAINADMRSKLKDCEDQKALAERARDDLQLQNQVQTQQLADLQTRLRTAAQPPPPPPLPPTPPIPGQGSDLAGADREVGTAPGMVTVTMAGDMLFASGKAALTARGMAVVNEIADTIKTRYAGHTVRVVGHTDSDPIRKSGWKDNWDLAFNRARAVGLALIARGVPAKNIEMVGLANNDPRVSPERTAADKAKNRRVVIQVAQ